MSLTLDELTDLAAKQRKNGQYEQSLTSTLAAAKANCESANAWWPLGARRPPQCSLGFGTYCRSESSYERSETTATAASPEGEATMKPATPMKSKLLAAAAIAAALVTPAHAATGLACGPAQTVIGPRDNSLVSPYRVTGTTVWISRLRLKDDARTDLRKICRRLGSMGEAEEVERGAVRIRMADAPRPMKKSRVIAFRMRDSSPLAKSQLRYLCFHPRCPVCCGSWP